MREKESRVPWYYRCETMMPMGSHGARVGNSGLIMMSSRQHVRFIGRHTYYAGRQYDLYC